MGMAISSKIRQFLDKVLFKQADLVADGVYQQYSTTARDPVTKSTTDMYTDIPVTMVNIGDKTILVSMGTGKAQSRARGYVIRSSELPVDYNPALALRDRLTVDSVSYAVLEVEKILDVAYFVLVEK